MYEGIEQYLLQPMQLLAEIVQQHQSEIAEAVDRNHVGIKELQHLVVQLKGEKKTLEEQVAEMLQMRAQFVEGEAR